VGEDLSLSGSEDIEEYAYDAPEIIWVAAPVVTKSVVENKKSPRATGAGSGKKEKSPKSSPRSKFRPQNPQSQVTRPKISKSVGYVVEVPSTLPGARDDEFFEGRVYSFDKGSRTIKITFVPEGDVDGSITDIEEYAYDAPEIIWVAAPPVASATATVDSNTAPLLGQALNWIIELLDDNGDSHLGVVTKVDERKGLLSLHLEDSKEDASHVTVDIPYSFAGLKFVSPPL
jgi:hypothetical protein